MTIATNILAHNKGFEHLTKWADVSSLTRQSAGVFVSANVKPSEG